MIYPPIKARLYIQTLAICLLPFSPFLWFNAPASVIDRAFTWIFALNACFSNALENAFLHLSLTPKCQLSLLFESATKVDKRIQKSA